MALPRTIAGVSVEQRPDWAVWVTPRRLLDAPIHRWFVFPHSFSADLVSSLSSEWKLGPRSTVLDPFVGAGTTLVACQSAGIRSVGIDISPLACLATRAKTSPPTPRRLRAAWEKIARRIDRSSLQSLDVDEYEELLNRAFTPKTLRTLHRAKTLIQTSELPARERDALLLALIRVLPRFSRLVNKGGWLAEVDEPLSGTHLTRALCDQVAAMTADLEGLQAGRARVTLRRGDVRALPLQSSSVSAIITSPPYPNRHDYTRVFGVELQFAFLDAARVRKLRYQSFHSHPEAHPIRPDKDHYREPRALKCAIDDVALRITDSRASQRIPRMLHGYFRDMYFALREMHRILRPGGRAALVVGNVQYCGIPIEVDRFTALISRQVGLEPERIVVARQRGNSAQQMKDFGRRPQRESVVILKHPR